MILCGDSIRERCDPIYAVPMIVSFHERTKLMGLSFGLSFAGYDIRIAETKVLLPLEFALASSIEKFNMPLDVLARVADKSTLARLGLAVQNTIIEPGWNGYLTLELTNHGEEPIDLIYGQPIAQIIFEMLDKPVDVGYDGKYQNQPQGAIEAIFES